MSKSYADVHRSTATGNTTTESKEDALTEMEFERFFDSTYSFDQEKALECRFLAVVLGRLGLRRGEACHIQSDWIDWDHHLIQIPRHYDCTDGRDGGRCACCRQLARQKARRDNLPIDDVLEDYWTPKSEAARREIYFGSDPRVRLAIERFFDRWSEWPWSVTVINRRVDDVTERTEGLSTDQVRPHSLRSSAATHQAYLGMDLWDLLNFFGWERISTAEKYLSRNALRTARNMDQRRRG